MKSVWMASAAALGVGLFAPSAFAQAQSGDVFTLGEVRVTARTPDGGMIGGATIGEEDLRTFDRGSVDEALDLIPGAGSSNTGGSRNERLVFIRGFDRFQTTLSIDGVRIFLPADNRIDFGRFLTADLAQIQVSKGYVSVLDGPGALGGAINLVTRRPTDPFEAELVANLGLDNTGSSASHGVSGRLGTRQGAWYVQASGAWNERAHWALPEDFRATALENGGNRDHSESEDYRANLKIGFTPNATDEYALSYTYQSGEKNAPYHVNDTTSTRYWAWPYWDIDSLTFLSNTQITPALTIRTRLYVNSFENALFAYDDARQSVQSLPRAFRSYYDDTAWGGRIEAALSVSDANTLRASYHFRRDEHVEWQQGFTRTPATGNPFVNAPFSEPRQVTEEDTHALALEDTQSFGPNTDLVVGVSYDWTDLRRAEDANVQVTGTTIANAVINYLPVTYPLRDMDAWNGQAALVHRFGDGLSAHVSVSSRARSPTLFERFSSRFGTAIPNPDIGPERATNIEIGAATTTGAVTLEGAVFYSDIQDALLLIPIVFPAPVGQQNQTRNVGDGEYYGAEIEARAAVSDALTLGGNYTFIERDITDPTNAAFQLTGVPRHRLFAFAQWAPLESVTVTPSFELTSKRWTARTVGTTTTGYYETGAVGLVNLAVNWRLTQNADMLVGGRNLTDQTYQLADGFPEEGRNFYISLRLRN